MKNKKPIYIHQDKPVKPFPVVQCVAGAALVIGVLVLLIEYGVIKIK